jgi:hypothetical protein
MPKDGAQIANGKNATEFLQLCCVREAAYGPGTAAQFDQRRVRCQASFCRNELVQPRWIKSGNDERGATAQNEKRRAARKLLVCLDKNGFSESLFE